MRLLVCVTASPHAPIVLRGAAQISRLLGAEQQWLHVGADSAESQRRLSATFEAAGVAYPADQLVFRAGNPVRVICQTANDFESDLIVLGALEQENLLRDVFGSTARQVARKAPCSVFLLTDQEISAVAWRWCVAGIELNDSSAAMLALLVKLLRGIPGSHLHIVNEHESYLAASQSPELRQLKRDNMLEDRNSAESFQFSELIDAFDFGDISVTTEWVADRAGIGVVQYSRDRGADLAAIAAPRPLGLWDRFFGNSAEACLQQLPCSLLLCRQRKQLATKSQSWKA